ADFCRTRALCSGPVGQPGAEGGDGVTVQAVQREARVVQAVQVSAGVGDVLRVEGRVGGVGEFQHPGERVTFEGGGHVDVIADLAAVDQGGDLRGDQV